MDGSTRSIADATSISHHALLLQCLWTISYRSTRHLDVKNEVRHSIDHHRMAIVIYESYLAHVDHMEVQFNNEGLNMFVHALSQSPFIPEQVSIAASSKPANPITIIPFINIPIATHQGTCYPFYWVPCAVPRVYISSHMQVVSTLSEILSYVIRFMFGIFQVENRRNRGVFGVKISVHVLPKLRGVDTLITGKT